MQKAKLNNKELKIQISSIKQSLKRASIRDA